MYIHSSIQSTIQRLANEVFNLLNPPIDIHKDRLNLYGHHNFDGILAGLLP